MKLSVIHFVEAQVAHPETGLASKSFSLPSVDEIDVAENGSVVRIRKGDKTRIVAGMAFFGDEIAPPAKK